MRERSHLSHSRYTSSATDSSSVSIVRSRCATTRSSRTGGMSVRCAVSAAPTTAERRCGRRCGLRTWRRRVRTGALITSDRIWLCTHCVCAHFSPFALVFRIVECSWACKRDVRAAQLLAHEGTQCDHRPVPCRNKCDGFVRAKDQATHERDECVKRFVDCPLKCGTKIREMDISEHTKQECEKRMMECLLGCGTTVKANR